MSYLLESLQKSISLIFTLNPEILQVWWVSLKVSFTSLFFSTLLALPLGLGLTRFSFKGRDFIITFFNTLTALPTVVVGLLVYSLLCGQGLLGQYGLLYTPLAMVLGQIILITPLLVSFIIGVLEKADPRIFKTARSLGASKTRATLTLLNEMRFPLSGAVLVAFGRAFSEVGISLMLGGNIKNYTRNIPTAIALETSRGEFVVGLALGIVLVFFAFLLNFSAQILLRRKNGTL